MPQSLKDLIDQLPPELEQEVRDFVELLLAKHRSKIRARLHRDWAGGLQQHRERYTSLQLQKEAPPMVERVLYPVDTNI